MAYSVDPEQTAPIGAVCSGSTLFASILNLSVMLGNYLQQTTLADDIILTFSFHFSFLCDEADQTLQSLFKTHFPRPATVVNGFCYAVQIFLK